MCFSFSLWDARSHWEILGEEKAPIPAMAIPTPAQEGPQQHVAVGTEPAARTDRNVGINIWVAMGLLALSMLALGWLLGHKVTAASQRRKSP